MAESDDPPSAEDIVEAAAAAARAEAERIIERRRSSIEAGRRKGGVAGAALAGAMTVVAEIYEGPPKDDAPVTVEASSDPHDVDRDGIEVTHGDTTVSSPALERRPPDQGDNGVRL